MVKLHFNLMQYNNLFWFNKKETNENMDYSTHIENIFTNKTQETTTSLESMAMDKKLKLKILKDYVKNVKIINGEWEFYDLVNNNKINFSSSNPEAIAVLKTFWVFSELKILDDTQLPSDLTDEKALLDIFLGRQRLLVGWNHLVSKGVTIKVNDHNYIPGGLFKFNSNFGELGNTHVGSDFESLSRITRWDLAGNQARFSKTFTKILDKLVCEIKTQGQEVYNPKYTCLIDDAEFWAFNPLSAFSKKDCRDFFSKSNDFCWHDLFSRHEWFKAGCPWPDPAIYAGTTLKPLPLDVEFFEKAGKDLLAPKGYFSLAESEEPEIEKYCRVVKEPLRPLVKRLVPTGYLEPPQGPRAMGGLGQPVNFTTYVPILPPRLGQGNHLNTNRSVFPTDQLGPPQGSRAVAALVQGNYFNTNRLVFPTDQLGPPQGPRALIGLGEPGNLGLGSQKKESTGHFGLTHESGFYIPRISIYYSANEKEINSVNDWLENLADYLASNGFPSSLISLTFKVICHIYRYRLFLVSFWKFRFWWKRFKSSFE